MPKFTNIGLVEYADAMYDYGSPYWYGTFGNIASEELYQAKKKQYKEQYEKWSKYSFETQYGLKVHDCIGLIKGYLMNPTIDENGHVQNPLAPSKYNSKYDISANGLEAKAKEKGPISTLPEIPGIIVWKSGHVGVYIGNGWVIEERGHSFGTVQTKVSERPWTEWLKHPDIEYVSEPTPTPKGEIELTVQTLKKGSKGAEVYAVQAILKAKGYKGKDGKVLALDSSWGGNVDYAFGNWQKDAGLVVDRICGAKSWDKLLKG